MAGFTGTHTSNILDSVPVPSWRNIKRGQLISAKYKSGNTAVAKPRLYLVLQTFFPKVDGKMHVLDLDYISPDRLKKKLMKHVIGNAPLEETFRNKTFTRLEFKNSEKDLYNVVIKPLVNDGFGPSYRTIFPQNLKNIRILNYEWFEGKSETSQGETKEERDNLEI